MKVFILALPLAIVVYLALAFLFENSLRNAMQ